MDLLGNQVITLLQAVCSKGGRTGEKHGGGEAGGGGGEEEGGQDEGGPGEGEIEEGDGGKLSLIQKYGNDLSDQCFSFSFCLVSLRITNQPGHICCTAQNSDQNYSGGKRRRERMMPKCQRRTMVFGYRGRTIRKAQQNLSQKLGQCGHSRERGNVAAEEKLILCRCKELMLISPTETKT